MSGNRIQKIVIRAIEKQSITVDDVQDLRKAIGEEGFISRAEAEALIRMELMVETVVPAWADLFVETLTAHLVWDCRPTGYVRHEDAAWLAGCCARPRLGGGHHIGALMAARQLVAFRAQRGDDAFAVDQRLRAAEADKRDARRLRACVSHISLTLCGHSFAPIRL